MVSSRSRLIAVVALLLVLALVVIYTTGTPPATTRETVVGSGNEAMKEFDLSGFERIKANGGFQVDARQGDSYSVKVWTDDNVIPYLDVAVSGDTLRIGLKTDEVSSFTTHTLRAEVTMPELTSVNLNGGSKAQVAGFTSDKDVAFDLDGGSQLTGEMTGGNAQVNVNGGSQIEISGQVANIDLTTTGAGNALLANFPATDAKVDSSGGGRNEVNASGEVTGKVSGGAMLQVSGDPSSVNVETSGGSAVETK